MKVQSRNKKKDHGRLRKEGFWTNTSSFGYYPSNSDVLPIANEEPWEGQSEFLESLIQIEDALLERYQVYVDRVNDGDYEAKNPGHVIGYRGFSVCRICGCANGSLEFRRYGWVWPEGFRHYIEVHNVKPSFDFIEFVLELSDKKIIRNSKHKSDKRYRLLSKDEIILKTDEYYNDDIGEWVKPRCVGKETPDPGFTSHRKYRRALED